MGLETNMGSYKYSLTVLYRGMDGMNYVLVVVVESPSQKDGMNYELEVVVKSQ
jgi:hypothetical protein